MRAAIYARFSEDDKKGVRGSGVESVAVQERFAREAVKEQKWTLDEEKRVYVDDGISGREILRRPNLQRMLRDAASGAFDVIVLRDLDRFSRAEPARTLGLLQDLTDVSVTLWEYTSRKFISMEDTTDALLVAIKATVSASEARKNQPRIIDALRHRDELGHSTHLAPFGFKNKRKRFSTGEVGDFAREGTTGVFVRDEDEIRTVLRIGELFLTLGSYHGVASKLNAEGTPGPNGGTWTNRTVHAVLVNPFYRGNVARGVTMAVERRGTLLRIAAPVANIRNYAHPELRVWPPEMEVEIDALVATRTKKRGTPVRRHLASSFVRCSKCGSSITATSSKRSKSASYCCDKARARGCTGIGYKAEHKVDAAIIGALVPHVGDEVLRQTLEIVRQALDTRRDIDTHNSERDRLVREIAATERRMRAARELVLDSEGAEQHDHRASLRHQLTRLNDLKASLAKLEGGPALPDPKAVLAALEHRIMGLRKTLNLGGVHALPAVAAIMGEDKFVATRVDAEGRVTEWRLSSRISTAYLFAGIGDQEKLSIKGVVPSATSAETPSSSAPAATPAQVAQATQPAPVAQVSQPAQTASH